MYIYLYMYIPVSCFIVFDKHQSTEKKQHQTVISIFFSFRHTFKGWTFIYKCLYRSVYIYIYMCTCVCTLYICMYIYIYVKNVSIYIYIYKNQFIHYILSCACLESPSAFGFDIGCWNGTCKKEVCRKYIHMYTYYIHPCMCIYMSELSLDIHIYIHIFVRIST